MRIRTCVAVGFVSVCGLVGLALPVDAQVAPSAPPFGPAPPKPPLFDPQSALNDSSARLSLREIHERLQSQAQSALQGMRPKVVCGMTVIPAQPEVDPKSIKKVPQALKFTMRSVRPPMCGDSAQAPDVPPQPEPPAPDVQPAQPTR